MKIWSDTYVFNQPWEATCQAAWNKYPNPFNPAVENIDVLERSLDRRGVLHSSRVLKTRWGFPSWVASITGYPGTGYAYEKSTVDPSRKVFEMKTTNLTLTSWVTFDEIIEYKPDPQDQQRTILR